jgi:hypothetical protein
VAQREPAEHLGVTEIRRLQPTCIRADLVPVEAVVELQKQLTREPVETVVGPEAVAAGAVHHLILSIRAQAVMVQMAP